MTAALTRSMEPQGTGWNRWRVGISEPQGTCQIRASRTNPRVQNDECDVAYTAGGRTGV